MDWFKFDMAAWKRDTAHLSDYDRGIYLNLLIYYYQTERPLPADRRHIARHVLGMWRASSRHLDVILDRFFSCTERGFVNNRAEQEIAEYHARSKRSANAARSRWDAPGNASGNAASNAQRNAKQTNIQTNIQEPVDNSKLKPTGGQRSLYCANHPGTLAAFWNVAGTRGHCRDCGPV